MQLRTHNANHPSFNPQIILSEKDQGLFNFVSMRTPPFDDNIPFSISIEHIGHCLYYKQHDSWSSKILITENSDILRKSWKRDHSYQKIRMACSATIE